MIFCMRYNMMYIMFPVRDDGVGSLRGVLLRYDVGVCAC